MNLIVTALSLLFGLVLGWHYWITQRKLELSKEYDELADSRRDFWDNLDKAYKVFEPSSKYRLADKLIRGLFFQPVLCPDIIKNLRKNKIPQCFWKKLKISEFELEQLKHINVKIIESERRWQIIYRQKEDKECKEYKVIKEGSKIRIYNNLIKVYPPIKLGRIKDDLDNDLLEEIWRLEDEIKRISSSSDDSKKNLVTLWNFAKFIYPNEKRDQKASVSYTNDIFNKKDLEKLDIARGKLARFWNKWASKRFLNCHLLKYYNAAHEQLIMLTWLELALARQIEDRGRGKIKLFEFTKKVDDIIKR